MDNNPILHNDILGDTLSPIGNIIYNIFHDGANGDQKGSLTNATRQDYEISPVKAALKDAGWIIAQVSQLNRVDDASATLGDPNSTKGEKVQAGIEITLSGAPGEGSGGKPRFSNESNVVRGGLGTPESIARGTDTHPEGVTGISVECGTCSVKELSKNVPHNQIRTTTVGEVRAAGGDVIKTSGGSPNHATLTGLDPFKINELFNPPIKNPNKP
jgi:hypothetical protein